MAVGKGFGVAKQAVEEVQKAAATVDFNKFSLKIPEGETSVKKRVRFIKPEDMITFIEHWTEYKNGWKRNYVCPNEDKMGADNCITCSGKPGVDYVKDQRKHAHMLQLINRESGQVEVWKFSPMAMATLIEVNDALGNISDRDFTIEFMENANEQIKAKFVYVIEPATPKPEPLSKADLALTAYDLEALVPKYDEANLKNIAVMTPEESKKGGLKKATVTAADFASQALGGSKNLMDEFTSLTTKANTTKDSTAPTDEELAEFQKMMSNL